MSSVPHARFLVFVAVCVAAGAALVPVCGPVRAFVLGFDAGAAVFLVSCLPILRDDGADRIRARALRDDGGRALLLVVAAAALASVLVALVGLLGGADTLTVADRTLALATMLLAWVFANTVFAFHYAHLYYDQVGGADRGGLAFPGDTPPVFTDFLYFALVIGMTCQVSDVTLTTAGMRRVALVHGVLAFVFNLGVLALAVNVLASQVR